MAVASTASMPEIKPEIKVEGARDMADVDEFEEDTDLQVPAPGAQAWLVKVPKDVWQAWNTVYNNVPDDSSRVQIGTMRVYQPKEGDAPQDVTKQRIEMRLDQTNTAHQDIASNYELKLTTTGYANTVVFAEKDLPGHKSQPFRRGRYLQPNRPTGVQSKDQRYGRPGAGNTKPGYRTAIPKQTFLAPMIAHEANAAPKEDDEYLAIFQKKWNASIAPKSRTTYIEGVDRAMHPGMSNLSSFNSFGLSSKPGGKAGNRGKALPKEKAVRMEEPELIDALQRCFRKYTYWSLKTLRNELKQPESYIKETLDIIATLIRSGDFANAYVLKPEYAGIVKAEDHVKDEVAPKMESDADMGTADELGDDGDGDDDDGAEFEDVRIGGEGGS